MAISETTLKDVMLMLIEEQNKKGGVLGRQLEASSSIRHQLAAVCRKGTRADCQGKVAATFGGWTSVSRKSVLPVFKELNNILFYPVQYEARNASASVYTGAARTSSAFRLSIIYERKDGGEAKRWVWPAPTISIRAQPTRS